MSYKSKSAAELKAAIRNAHSIGGPAFSFPGDYPAGLYRARDYSKRDHSNQYIKAKKNARTGN